MKPDTTPGDPHSELRRRDFLKYAAGGVAAGALGANGVMDARAQAILKADRSLLTTWPTLTSATKNWRWDRIRSMMADNDVDAMLIMNDQASRYLSEMQRTTLLFPIDDEPVAFSVFGSGAMEAEALMKGEEAGIESWVRDIRSAQGTPVHLAEAIREKNLENARIGTFGVEQVGHIQRRTGNWRPGGLANALRQQLPGLEFVELWDEFMQLWLVKNDEETAMFRKAAAAAELACELFRDACVPGNTLADVKAAAYSEPSRYGVEMVHLWTGGGPDGGREIPWLRRGFRPPEIRRGDLIVGEFMVNCGSLNSQICISVSVGPLSGKKRELAEICRESYDACLDAIRPGMEFSELGEVMAEPLRRAGAWQMSPLIHTLNPTESVTVITEGILGPRGYPGVRERFAGVELRELGEDRGDLILEAGMAFQIEPNAAFERTFVNTGGSLMLHVDGAEELNPICSKVIELDV